jgi:hypothetical protein
MALIWSTVFLTINKHHMYNMLHKQLWRVYRPLICVSVKEKNVALYCDPDKDWLKNQEKHNGPNALYKTFENTAKPEV